MPTFKKCIIKIFQICREFKAIVSFEEDYASLMDGWIEISEKIVELSKIECSTRPYLKKLQRNVKSFLILMVNMYMSFDTGVYMLPHLDARDNICLELLYRLLYPRGLGKNAVFIKNMR